MTVVLGGVVLVMLLGPPSMVCAAVACLRVGPPSVVGVAAVCLRVVPPITNLWNDSFSDTRNGYFTDARNDACIGA